MTAGRELCEEVSPAEHTGGCSLRAGDYSSALETGNRAGCWHTGAGNAKRLPGLSSSGYFLLQQEAEGGR